MKLTPWYPWSIKPVREGYYEYRGWQWDGSRMYWNGNQWGYWQGENWVHMAEIFTDEWRGLTSRSGE